MARIEVADVQAWVEVTKFTVKEPLPTTDANLLGQIETETVSRLSGTYAEEYPTWIDHTSTPPIVKVIIAKLFAAWMYRKAYSESLAEEDAAYAAKLEMNAEMLISGLIDGTIDIPGGGSDVGPVFYPTDASSAMRSTRADPSLGPSKFSMGMTF